MNDASVYLEKFANEVDPLPKLINNSSGFHNEIISMTMSGYLIYLTTHLLEEVYEWGRAFFTKITGCKL